MKNIAFSKGRQSETVAHQDMIDALDPNYEYQIDDIFAIFHDSPRACVRDTLYALVDRGVIWRNTSSHSRVKYALLEGDTLRDTIERKTIRGELPDWMKTTLTGFDAQNARFRELCMSTRK